MQLPDSHDFHVNLSWKGDSIGVLSAPGVEEKIEVSTPSVFPNGIEGVWSPEHLYTASVVSCLFTSFTAIAAYSNFEFIDLRIKSTGSMTRNGKGKYIMSSISLKPVLTIEEKSNEKKANRILEKAEEICLISRSIDSEIFFEPSIYISEKVG